MIKWASNCLGRDFRRISRPNYNTFSVTSMLNPKRRFIEELKMMKRTLRTALQEKGMEFIFQSTSNSNWKQRNLFAHVTSTLYVHTFSWYEIKTLKNCFDTISYKVESEILPDICSDLLSEVQVNMLEILYYRALLTVQKDCNWRFTTNRLSDHLTEKEAKNERDSELILNVVHQVNDSCVMSQHRLRTNRNISVQGRLSIPEYIM